MPSVEKHVEYCVKAFGKEPMSRSIELMQELLESNREIRLVGVKLSNFISAEKQKTLA